MTRQEAAEIYRTHSKAIYNTALRIVRNPDEAEEIMQDTLMKFFSKGIPGLPVPKQAAWLRTTCIRMSIDTLRRRKKAMSVLEGLEADEAEEASDPDLPDTALDVMRIREAMERMRYPYNLILDLVLIEGLDYAEISRLTGQKEATLRSWYSRGRARLAKELKAYTI